MKERAALAKQLDALYAGPREDFVAGRNALATRLKGEGRDEEVAYVGGLSKPSVAAALLNRLAVDHPAEMKAYAKAAGALRRASGQRRGDRLRATVKAERAAAAELLAHAERELGAGGRANPSAVLERVAETLQAAAADPDVEQLVTSGRLDKERSVASIGFELGAVDEKPAKHSDAARKADQRRQKQARSGIERARRSLEAAQRALEAAESEVSAAEEGLERARSEREDAGERVAGAEAELRERERALADLD